jgi:hypothetical protein
MKELVNLDIVIVFTIPDTFANITLNGGKNLVCQPPASIATKEKNMMMKTNKGE